MAHNQLSEKLDLITDAELNVDFDGIAVWLKLEERLDGKKRMTYWWTVAASILLLTLFLPISILEETATQPLGLSETVDLGIDQYTSAEPGEKEETLKEKQFMKPHKSLERKRMEGIKLAQVSQADLILEPLSISRNTTKQAAFDAEDISIIQASLERSQIGKGRTMTIRAQWQKSPTKSNVEHQALKIKLYEKQE